MKRLTVLAAALGTIAIGATTWADPRPELGLGHPHDASRHGWRIDWLIDTTNLFVAGLFLTMVVWMLIACFRHGEKHPARYVVGGDRRSVTVTLGISAAIFFVVDGNLFVNSTLDLEHVFWNFEEVDRDPRTLQIEVNAHQWAWDVRYAGTDGRFATGDDVVLLNELRVPVGTRVSLQLGSTDVIHCMYLPNFRIKQDVIPGNVTRMWFEARETGEFDVGCAQHCGVGHYKMKGRLTVLPRRQWQEWFREASAIAVRGYDERDADAQWGWAWRPTK